MANKILCLICLLCVLFYNEKIYASDANLHPIKFQTDNFVQTEQIKTFFEHYLSFMGEDINFNQEPRGLVVSINSQVFFEQDSIILNEYSKPILEMIGYILNYIGKPCIIEGNAQNTGNPKDLTHLELSAVQAGRIGDFLIEKVNVHPDKIRTIGFGNMSPPINNSKNPLDNIQRIDFVVLNYEQFKQ